VNTAGAVLDFTPYPAVFTLNQASRVTGAGNVSFRNGTVHIAGVYEVGSTLANGGTADFMSDVTLGALTLSAGSLTGPGTVTVNGVLTWTGGTMSGPGRTVANGGLVMSGGNPKTLDTRTLDNAGMATWTGTGSVTSVNDATWNNLAGAMFDLRNDGSFGATTFNNAGTLRKLASIGTTRVSVAFYNTGTVQVQTGVLSLGGEGVSSGGFSVAAGAFLEFSSGSNDTTVLAPGSSVTGPGDVRFSSGTVYVFGVYNITGPTELAGGTAEFVTGASTGTLALSNNGTLQAFGDVAVAGRFDWISGTLRGPGRIILAQGPTAISGSVPKVLDGCTIDNAGTATWTGADLSVGDGAVWNNLAGSTFDARGDLNFHAADSTLMAFNNAGTFRKSLGTNQTFVGVVFNNNGGTINVQIGTLSFAGDYTQNRGDTILAAGATLAAGGTVNILDGTLTGSGTVFSNVVSSGAINPGGTGSAGTLTVRGNYTQTDRGTLNIEIGGTAPGTGYDQLVVTGQVTLGGTLTVSLIQGFVPTIDNRFQILIFGSRSGDFAVENGLDPGGGLRLDPRYDATSLTLATTGGNVVAPQVTPPSNQNATEGASVSISLGSFTDPNSGPWTVMVNWSDGTSTTFTLMTTGSLDIQSHTYGEELDYTVAITVTNTADNQSGSGKFLVGVSDPAVVAAGGFPYMGAETVDPGPQVVAIFTDPSGPEALADYSATINWGDGSPLDIGTITGPDASGVFTVTGHYTYPFQGIYTISVTISHDSAPDATSTSTANIDFLVSYLTVNGFPSPTAAGTPGTFTVTAYDIHGSVDTTYGGTITFSSTDLAAMLPPDYTFGPADMGSQSFTATLNTVGTQSIIATDVNNSSVTGEQDNIMVTLSAPPPAPAPPLKIHSPSSLVPAEPDTSGMVSAVREVPGPTASTAERSRSTREQPTAAWAWLAEAQARARVLEAVADRLSLDAGLDDLALARLG
jgi:hypothetical protein